MSNSQSLDLWSTSEPKLAKSKPAVLYRIGYSLGQVFLSAKKKATSKYLEVTQGINERIEAENEQLRQEVDMLLMEQEIEHQSELKQCKKRCFLYSLVFAVIAFLSGAATIFFSLA